MRSDVSEFLRQTKPSLVSILARQAEWEESQRGSSPRRVSRVLLFATGGAALIILAGLVTYYSLRTTTPSAVPVPAATPGYIFYDEVVPIAVEGGRSSLLKDLAATARTPQPPASFRRLVVSDGGRAVTLDTLLGIASGAAAPPAFVKNLAAPPQIFLYRRGQRVDAGMVIEPKSPSEALRQLSSAEPSLARDLEVLFWGDPPPLTLAPFEDRTYRNIDFRYRRMDPDDERGLGYLFFPAKRLIVIATSEEAIRATVDRLFLQR